MKGERRSDLSGMRFELLASLLSSWTDTRTEEERAKLHLCREQFTPLVFSHCLRFVRQLISLFQPALLTIAEKPAGGSLFYDQIIPPGFPLWLSPTLSVPACCLWMEISFCIVVERKTFMKNEVKEDGSVAVSALV